MFQAVLNDLGRSLEASGGLCEVNKRSWEVNGRLMGGQWEVMGSGGLWQIMGDLWEVIGLGICGGYLRGILVISC